MPLDLPDDVLSALGRLKRRPDIEAPELVAVDAADRLALAEVRNLLAAAAPGDVAVLDDGYGALTLGALTLGAADVRVATDTVTSERAVLLNAALLPGLGPPDRLRVHAPLDPAVVDGARVVLARLPRSLDALAELADLVADHARPDVVLLATGRLKHMSRRMNDVLRERFSEVAATLAHGKARALTARRPVPPPLGRPPFPRRERVLVPGGKGSQIGLEIVAHGAAFAGPTVDIGTRALLDALDVLLDGLPEGPLRVVDLGCGTGVLATAVALRAPHATVLATDRSAAAVLSAAATAAANDVSSRVTTLRDDTAASVADASVDVVVCNPPFHAGAVVSTEIAEAMFRAAARVLRPGGELWAVWNSHLRYRPALERFVGPTAQVARNPKFTVTRSRRR